MGIDPKCEELARHFLNELKPPSTPREVADMCEAIQAAVDLEMFSIETNRLDQREEFPFGPTPGSSK